MTPVPRMATPCWLALETSFEMVRADGFKPPTFASLSCYAWCGGAQ